MKKISTLLTCFAVLISTLTFSQMEHKPGEALVQFKSNTSPKEVIDNLAQTLRNPTDLELGQLLSKPMNIYSLNFNPETVNEINLLRKLKADKNISIAQFNHYVYPRETVPNDPSIDEQWHHVNNGDNGTEDSDIDSDLAWDITTGGTTALGDTIVVCIIEGGNLLHPDLIENAWFNYGEIPDNGIDDDANGYIDDYRGWNVNSEDDNDVYSGGHGTNVMGMIGAKGDNEFGTVGANWNVKMMSVAGESLFDEASVVQAYTYPLIQRQIYNESNGESGAFVVATNASWGIDNGNVDDVPIWTAFYDTLGQYGILNCGATANNNVNIDVVGDIPTAAPSDYMISVTATNSSDFRTFSGFGAITVDLGAPGENVFTSAGQNGTTTTSGTSFASPLTAGVIALLYSAPCSEFAQMVHDNPQLGADYIRSVLFDGVDPIENLEFETVTGGRLNAFNSLTLMLNNCAGDFCLSPFSFNYELENDTVYNFTWTTASDTTSTLRFRLLGTEEWTYVEDIATTSFSIDTLSLCVDYEFEIASNCSGDLEELDFESSIIVETKGCCIAPANYEAEVLSDNEVGLSWGIDFNIPNYEVFYRIEGELEWVFDGTSSSGEYLINSLDSCTFYEVLIKPSCVAGFDVGSNITIRTTGCGNCIDLVYCEAFGENSSEEYIDIVEIGEYINESGNNGGLALFEDEGIVFAQGGEYPTTLTPGFPGQSFSEYFKLWVDLDQDGTFSDEELLLESESGSSEPVSGTVTIPENALLGNTRMRIAMRYVGGFGSSPPQACGDFNYGEIEDYCITIAVPTGLEGAYADDLFEMYPNPAKDSFTINIKSDNMPNSAYVLKLVDTTGKSIFETSVNSGSNQVYPNVSAGIYMVQLITLSGEIARTDRIAITK